MAWALALLIQEGAQEVLARAVELSVESASLEEFAEALGGAAHISVVVDPAIYEQAPGAGMPVTLRATGRSVRSILRGVLGPRGLTAVWRDGIVIVPRPTAPLETRRYDIGDILDAIRDAPAAQERDPLGRAGYAVFAMGLPASASAVTTGAVRITPAADGRAIAIEVPQIGVTSLRSTIIVPNGGTTAMGGLGSGQGAGGGGLHGDGTAHSGVLVDVEVVEIDPDAYYGYDEGPDPRPARGGAGSITDGTLTLVGETLVASLPPGGHSQLERILEWLRHR